MFFNGWFPILRVLVVGVCAYAALVFFLRISGKRTLSKLNAFDLVVTVSLGSTMATLLLSRDTALAEGAAAFAVLIALQFVVAWLSVRSSMVGRLVKSEPRLLFYRGEYLRDAMRRERVTEGEVLAAIREARLAGTEEVEAVVLETASTISVVMKSGARPNALINLQGFPR